MMGRFIHRLNVLLISCFLPGQHPKNQAHLLQGQRLQEAHPAQSHTIQSRQGELQPLSPFVIESSRRMYSSHETLGLVIRTRKAKIRPQAIRIWRSDQTRVQEEGKDNQEGSVETGVHIMQDEGTTGIETMQAFRTGVRWPLLPIAVEIYADNFEQW